MPSKILSRRQLISLKTKKPRINLVEEGRSIFRRIFPGKIRRTQITAKRLGQKKKEISSGSTNLLARNTRLLRNLKLGSIGLVFISIITLIVSLGINFSRLEFVGKNLYLSPQWDGRSELNLLVIGVSNKENNLNFVDLLEVVHVQPQTNKLNIIAVDVNLGIKLANIRTNVKTTYTLRQLYNYYLAQDLLTGSNNALANFIDQVEQEVGLKLPKFVMINKSNMDKLTSKLGDTYVNNSSLDWNQQLDYISLDKNSHDNQLQNQTELLKAYLLSTNTPVFWLKLVPLILTNSFPKLLVTNLTSGELLKLFLAIRSIPNSSINTLITPAREIYLDQESKLLDTNLFASDLKNLYVSQAILLEQARIDVINGDKKAGLANRTQRLLENYGLTVVRTTNAEQIYVRNTLYVVNPDKYPISISYLKQLYPDLEIFKAEYPYRPLGDLVIVVL